MLVTEPMVQICFIFQDRNDNEGRTYAYLPFAVSDSQVRGFVAFYMSYLRTLSNATIIGWTAKWSAINLTPDMAPTESDVSQNLVLLYRDDDVFDWIWVPSPRLDLLEVEGDYAGIRLDALRPDVLSILEGWQDVITTIVNSRGDIFPIEFAVGGLAYARY